MSHNSWAITDNDLVTITMSRSDYAPLLLVLGYAAGSTHSSDRRFFWSIAALANRINEGNPNWNPYEIPPEYRS